VKYRLLALLVLGATVAHLLAARVAPSPEALSVVHFTFRVSWRAAATVACFAAALAFARGDYLRRGWLLLGATLLLLLVKDLWRGPSLHGLLPQGSLPVGAPGSLDVVRDVLVVAANAMGVAAAWVLARTWYRAGLSQGVSRGMQGLALAAAAAAALVTAGATLRTDLAALLAGHAEATALVASDLADLLSFVLFAPIVLTALALRGGLLGWTWGLLAAGNLAWLVMDVAQSLGALGHGTPTARLGEEVARTVAAACYVGAGLAQRWLLRAQPPARR
jgi:hypothetical protein